MTQNVTKKNDTNLAMFIQPGLYAIKCLKNGRVYVGQSKNLLERLGKHSALLMRGLSDSSELQDDWNLHGPLSFEMHVLATGALYATETSRKSEERKYLEELSSQGVPIYNHLTQYTGERNTRQPVEIDGVEYYSINAAMKALDIAETTMRRYLKDPRKETYKLLKPIEVGYSKVSIDGVLYNGVVNVVEAGLAKNRFAVMRRLKSSSKLWKDWVYIDSAYDSRNALKK